MCEEVCGLELECLPSSLYGMDVCVERCERRLVDVGAECEGAQQSLLACKTGLTCSGLTQYERYYDRPFNITDFPCHRELLNTRIECEVSPVCQDFCQSLRDCPDFAVAPDCEAACEINLSDAYTHPTLPNSCGLAVTYIYECLTRGACDGATCRGEEGDAEDWCSVPN